MLKQAITCYLRVIIYCPEAIERLKGLAIQHPHVYYALGLHYETGSQGVSANISQAIAYYEQAARMNPDAIERLRNLAKARDLEAMCAFARLLENGIGVPKNVAEARILYAHAADLKYMPAISALARLCENKQFDECRSFSDVEETYKNALVLYRRVLDYESIERVEAALLTLKELQSADFQGRLFVAMREKLLPKNFPLDLYCLYAAACQHTQLRFSPTVQETLIGALRAALKIPHNSSTLRSILKVILQLIQSREFTEGQGTATPETNA